MSNVWKGNRESPTYSFKFLKKGILGVLLHLGVSIVMNRSFSI